MESSYTARVMFLMFCVCLTSTIAGRRHDRTATTTTMFPFTLPSTVAPAMDVNLNTRIVGGKSSLIEEHPYQLHMTVKDAGLCGAAVISRDWALTAAHCCFASKGRPLPPARVTLRAGSTSRSSGGKVHAVTQVRPHLRYSETTSDNDICLLKVGTQFELAAVIALPPLGASPFLPGTTATVSGWGKLREGGPSTDHLMTVSIPLISNENCKRRYSKYKEANYITERQICAYREGRDSCQGDSGGALVANGTLVGIVSWGIGCGSLPGIYTRVSAYRSWITNFARI